jgi:hypothetical protein
MHFMLTWIIFELTPDVMDLEFFRHDSGHAFISVVWAGFLG